VTVPPVGTIVLLGWTESPSPIDDGMPDWVANILADAMTARHVATFPSTSKAAERAEHVTALHLSHVLRVRGPRNFNWVSTRERELVRGAFDDPGFPWTMQGQIVLLTPLHAPIPQLDADEVIGMLAPQAHDAHAWSRAGVAVQVRAAVDGDLAAIFSVSSNVEAALIEEIERAAAAAHIETRQVSDAELATALAGPS
jgi:hypothetical protein